MQTLLALQLNMQVSTYSAILAEGNLLLPTLYFSAPPTTPWQEMTVSLPHKMSGVNRVVGPTLGFEDKFCMAPLVLIIVLASQRHLLSLPLYVFTVVHLD